MSDDLKARGVREIISDEAVTSIHGNANFGSMTPRDVLADGVLKYAMGYSGGHTQLCILMEHKLIRKPKPGRYSSTLTKLGQKYLRAAWPIAELRATAALSDHPTVKALVAEAEARVLEGLLTDSTVQFAMGQRICCDGRECGCMGADVGSYIEYLAKAARAEAATIRKENP
jgi:hypothetical protein